MCLCVCVRAHVHVHMRACVCVYMCARNREFMMRTGDVSLGEQTSRGGPKEDMGGTVKKKNKRKAGGGRVCVCALNPRNRPGHRARLKLIQSREDTQT